MLFTFSASGSRAGIGAREFALNSSDHHSHDGLLRHLHHRLPQTGCVIPTVLMRVSSSRTARKQPADEDVIIAVVGTRAVYKLTRFRERPGAVRTESPLTTS